MKAVRSRVLLAAAAAGLMLTASPAFAWVCVAKNARGATYSAVGVLPSLVCSRALAKCQAGSLAPATCKVISSHL